VPTAKQDLVIHYDEAQQRLVLYSTDSNNTEKIRTTEFDGVCPDVAFFKEKTPSEAEETLGSMVFALLDLHAERKIGIRDYASISEQSMLEYISELEQAVAQGDVEAHYHLHIQLHSSAMKRKSLADLERSEALLRFAAERGYGDAVKSLENWPLLRSVAQRRIHRGEDA